jgi:hypothetical protein
MAISFIVLKVSWNVDQRDGGGGVPTAALGPDLARRSEKAKESLEPLAYKAEPAFQPERCLGISQTKGAR